jgi:Rps23 Pro-64 3,4-dihydroxylase Tpa1-like proline 4-hydroxylase
MEHKKYRRDQIADLILLRLTEHKDQIAREYVSQPIAHFVIDDLLPTELAHEIYGVFPATSQMKLKKSLRERKYVTAQMDRCAPLLEETIFSFHDPRIVALVSELTGLEQVEPDRQLYAGGISVMDSGHFLNPHIDNSHDKVRQRYRVLNLLYYVSPEWQQGYGGDLELWPDGPRGKQISIPCTFNRLVVMATSPTSWHSVNTIRRPAPRCCVSNYYFSGVSPTDEDYFHVTSFRGRPEQPLRDFVLRADIRLRMLLRKIRPTGIVENKHFYRKSV